MKQSELGVLTVLQTLLDMNTCPVEAKLFEGKRLRSGHPSDCWCHEVSNNSADRNNNMTYKSKFRGTQKKCFHAKSDSIWKDDSQLLDAAGYQNGAEVSTNHHSMQVTI